MRSDKTSASISGKETATAMEMGIMAATEDMMLVSLNVLIWNPAQMK